MKQCENNANTLIISILFICLSFDWYKKTSRHLNFGETFMFVGVAVRKNFSKQFIMDLAKVIKISLHLQR